MQQDSVSSEAESQFKLLLEAPPFEEKSEAKLLKLTKISKFTLAAILIFLLYHSFIMMHYVLYQWKMLRIFESIHSFYISYGGGGGEPFFKRLI